VITWNVPLDRLTKHTGLGNLACCVGISRDGQRVAAGAYDGRLYLWDFDKEQPRLVARGHDGPIYAVSTSPSGETIVTEGCDKVVRMWNAKKGASEKSFYGHPGLVVAVSYDDCRQCVLAAGKDKSLTGWKTNGGITPVAAVSP